jgi:hypothetical protein
VIFSCIVFAMALYSFVFHPEMRRLN